MPTKSGGAVAKSYAKSSYKTASRGGLDAGKTASSPSSWPPPPSTAASASAASGTAGGGVPGPSGGGVARGVAAGGGGGAGGEVRAGASNGRGGAAPGAPPGGTMKGATGRAFVDGGGGGDDRRGKTHAKSYAKYSPGGFASDKNAGPVGGGCPADLGGGEENGGGGASAGGGEVPAAVGVGENSSAAPPGAGGGVGAGGGGALNGMPGVAATGGFETKPFGEGDSNRPPSPFGGGEGGQGMFKTTAGEGVGPDKSPAISMANIMKGWTRENGGGGGSQSTPSDGGGGDGYLPGAVQSGAVASTSAGPTSSSPSLLAPEGSSPDRRSASRTTTSVPSLPATAAEGVVVIGKEAQQAPVTQQIPRSQQRLPQPIGQFGQFGTSTGNTVRIGSATRLGSLASFGIAVQGRDNRGGRGVPAGGAAAATSGLSSCDDKAIGLPSTGATNSGKVETPTAGGGGGEGDDGARRPLSVTMTDPRTGKERIITASKNVNP
jgi:hypothetical protein